MPKSLKPSFHLCISYLPVPEIRVDSIRLDADLKEKSGPQSPRFGLSQFRLGADLKRKIQSPVPEIPVDLLELSVVLVTRAES